MSTYTNVRAMVRVDVADTARTKADAEGKTLAEKVADLLEAVHLEAPRVCAAARQQPTASG